MVSWDTVSQSLSGSYMLNMVLHLLPFPVIALTLCWHSVAPYDFIQLTCPAENGGEGVFVLYQHAGQGPWKAGVALGSLLVEE